MEEGEGGGKLPPLTLLISGNIHHEDTIFGTDILPALQFLKIKKTLTLPF